MAEPKSFAEFTMKDWKNFGIYVLMLGLVILFVGKNFEVGIGFTLVGLVFTAILYGPKIFKILKKENW